MRFVLHRRNGNVALGALKQNVLFGAKAGSAAPTDLQKLLAAGPEAMQKAYDSLLHGEEIDPSEIEYLPPLPSPEKIICLGLNYKDHAAESGFEPPKYPALFGRFPSSLIGHAAPIVRARVSHQLDYEGELVAVVGKPGRDIPVERALEHVAGYSIFNDASVRDYQFKSAQWTIGKNFDATGAFGPAFVSADELEPGARGLRLTTRLNGVELQSASTTDMIFDVATQISLMSEAMLLKPGDVFVTGTPSGVGAAREPKIFMKPGDICEAVAPGAIQTDFSGGVVRDNPAVNKMVSDATALGRPGLPDDIGPMIASLLTEDNRWVNAQRMEVSGGQSI